MKTGEVRQSGKSEVHTASAPVAALLGWILPGLGHYWIGEKQRGAVFCIVTVATFWGGVAIGGVRSTVTERENGLWIAAQLCVGPQSLVAIYFSRQLAGRSNEKELRAFWPASNISVIYSSVAGLLNLLIIIDVLARSERMRRPAAVRAPPR